MANQDQWPESEQPRVVYVDVGIVRKFSNYLILVFKRRGVWGDLKGLQKLRHQVFFFAVVKKEARLLYHLFALPYYLLWRCGSFRLYCCSLWHIPMLFTTQFICPEQQQPSWNRQFLPLHLVVTLNWNGRTVSKRYTMTLISAMLRRRDARRSFTCLVLARRRITQKRVTWRDGASGKCKPGWPRSSSDTAHIAHTSSRTHTAPHRTAPHRTAPHRTALPISVAQVVALFLLIIWVVVVPRVLLLMATFHVGLMTR